MVGVPLVTSYLSGSSLQEVRSDKVTSAAHAIQQLILFILVVIILISKLSN